MRMTSILPGLLCIALVGCSTPPRPNPGGLPPPRAAGTSVEAELARGDAAWRSGKTDVALYAYLRAQQIAPKDDVPWLRIGALHESLGHSQLAIRAWQMAALRNERNGLTRQRLGYGWLREGELARAEFEFTHAWQLDPHAWRAAMGLGLVAEQRAELSAAREHYDAALAVQSADAELLTYSARLALAQDDLQRTELELAAAFVAGAQPETWLVLGDLIVRRGDYPGGFEAYLKQLSQPEAYHRLGDQALRVADYSRAVWYFERAAAASPVWFERAHKSLAVARERWSEQQRRAQNAPRP